MAFLARTAAHLKGASRLPARAFSVSLDEFGRSRFMGDVADEFLKPQGMSWADMEVGNWTTDPATADKVNTLLHFPNYQQPIIIIMG